MKNGIELISAERHRQIEKEGWTKDHDILHKRCELSMVAALYASPVLLYQKLDQANGIRFIDPWPWLDKWDKRPKNGNLLLDPVDSVSNKQRIKNLSKVGALIAAEIDRLMDLE